MFAEAFIKSIYWKHWIIKAFNWDFLTPFIQLFRYNDQVESRLHNNSPSFAGLIGRNNKARGFLLPICKLRFSHFGLMTYQIKIFSRHLSKYSGIIKISSFFDLIIQLFMFTYSARHVRAFFLPIDRVYPLSIGVIPLFASHLPPIWAVFFFSSSQFAGVRQSVFQIAKLNSLWNQHIAKI